MGPYRGTTCPRTGTGGLLLLFLGSCDLADPGGQEDSCQFSHGTQLWQGSKASGSQSLSWSHQPHNGRASADWSRVTGVWERICLPHLTAQTLQIILLPSWKPGKAIHGVFCAESLCTNKGGVVQGSRTAPSSNIYKLYSKLFQKGSKSNMCTYTG